MEAYYQQQSVSPYFAGHYRQRGSEFGALAAGIGRAAIPIAKKFLWPVAKKIGRELFVQAAPEIVDVVAKKKSPKEALKSTVQKTVRNKSVAQEPELEVFVVEMFIKNRNRAVLSNPEKSFIENNRY